MPVVAVVNRKGGSGKSTLATHLAAYCSSLGHPVLLGDTDRNQSSMAWLRMREHNMPSPGAAIVGKWVDARSLLRPPPGTDHVVLDTPGGLHGFELARLVCHADAVLLPVCNSLFDRNSAAECWAELKDHPRVTSGRCRVAALGMRLDARTKSAQVLAQWAQSLGLPYLGTLRETQGYVRWVEHGLTLFDMPPTMVAADRAQWEPILEWLRPVLQPKVLEQEEVKRRIYKPIESRADRLSGITIPGALDQPLPQRAAAASSAIDDARAAPVQRVNVRPAAAELSAGAALSGGSPSAWGHRLGKMLHVLPFRRFLLREP